jgi:hypothetical protein
MRRNPRAALLVLFFVALGASAGLLAFQNGRTQEKNVGIAEGKMPEKMRKHQAQFPIADYEAGPESTDLKIRQRREAKGDRYDKGVNVRVELDSDTATTDLHWANEIPAFPLNQSTTVVLGTVTSAAAHLSKSRRTVYSEFTIELERTLKPQAAENLGPTIIADRVGGRVRKPDGSIGMYWVSGQGMPVVGSRYAFFLKLEEDSDFTIVTAYELREGKVYALDHPGGDHPFAKYEGEDEQSFLEELISAIANPPTGK